MCLYSFPILLYHCLPHNIHPLFGRLARDDNELGLFHKTTATGEWYNQRVRDIDDR
nr:MAG TPA: hypothetical protein [Caudoviricetes sp.]